jgi:hypothetical protein
MDARRISRLSDVELIRMLTRNAEEYEGPVLTLARTEAEARELPIDEAFIPADDDDPARSGGRTFEAAGKTVTCSHCAGRSFEKRHALLNTRGMTLLRLDWLNQKATILVCVQCGLVQFFSGASSPREVP